MRSRLLGPVSSPFVIGAVIGAVGVVLASLHLMAEYEDALFDQIVGSIVQPQWSETQKVNALAAETHELLKDRAKVFVDSGYVGFRDSWLNSADVHLLEGRGVCRSHASVLGRLLDRAGIHFRIVRIYFPEAGTWACHLGIEANAEGKWRAIEPFDNIVFPVDYAELSRHWNDYKNLAPMGYDPHLDKAEIFYTNWARIPVIMPAIKKILDVAAPEFASTVSLRSYLLNVYRVYEIGLLLVLFAVANYFLLRLAIVRSRRAFSLMKPAASF
jgi:hypothetical protein